MTIVTRVWKVDSQTPLNPYHIIETATEEGWPTQWLGLVNSISCPRGRAFGEAHFLLSATAFESITKDDAVDIEIEHENGTSTFTGYYAIRSQAITGGTEDSAQWVTLADRRWLLEKTAINKRYNLRSGPDAYHEDTTNGGTAYTWTEIVGDIWAELPAAVAGSAPSLPITPSSTPQNLVFEGMTAWDALNRVLTAIGCVVCLDPFAGTFTVEEAKATQAGLATLKTDNEDRMLWKYSPAELPATNYPEKVAVTFPLLPGEAGDIHQPFAGPPEVEEVSLGSTGIVGTKWPITDTMMAYDDNSAARTTRAGEIKDALLGLLKPMANPWGVVYSGIVEFVPGSQLTDVTWSSDGERGTRTIAKFSTVKIEWPKLLLEGGGGGGGWIKGNLSAMRIASAGIPEEAPYTGLVIGTIAVQNTSCDLTYLIDEDIDVVDWMGCVFDLPIGDLSGVWVIAKLEVGKSQDPEAAPGELTPCHFSADDRCCVPADSGA